MRERPIINYDSEHLKDILNSKSDQYKNPNIRPLRKISILKKKTLEDMKRTLSPLKYPAHVSKLVDNLDLVKSTCYNFNKFSRSRHISVKDFYQ